MIKAIGNADPTSLISNSNMFSAFTPALRDKANVMFEEIKADL
jgi:hypothetical protein